MDQKRIIYLHQSYLDRTATEEEVEEFRIALNLPETEAILKSLSDENWEHLSNDQFTDVSKESADQLFNDIIAVPQERSISRRLWTRIAAAAAIVIMFGAGSYFYFRSSQPKQEQFFAKNEIIIPGGNKAILTLANGQKISLTDATLGQVAAQSGVKISKTADGQLVYETTPLSTQGRDAAGREVVEYNTIEAPAGGQWQVKLPDGSLVFLNAMSSITYPTRFIGKERNVKISGEAYFEIAHNKTMPFKVSSQGQTVEVLGTHFDVMAYPDEKIIKTTLLEGSVKIANGGRSELLKPGEQAQVSAGGIKVTDEVDLEDVIAWKNGYFKFNESLESIMSKVARWYNVEVVYQKDLNKAQSFSGKILRSKNISSVLKIMELTEKVHFKIEGRKIIVMK